MADNNVFELSPSALGADETWTSEWQDMQSFAAVAAMLTGDELLDEARFEWSDDRVNVRLSQPWAAQVNPLSEGGSISAATPCQAKFVRLVVVNGSNPQGPTWKAQLTLLQGAPGGLIAPLVSFPRDGDPGQTVRAVLYGRRVGDVDPQYTQVLVDGSGFLVTTDGALPTANFFQQIVATTTPVQLTSLSPELRSSLSITNTPTASGNLYVRLGLAPDLAFEEYDAVVPPGAMWVAPRWGGDVWVVWDDDASGYANCQEVTG